MKISFTWACALTLMLLCMNVMAQSMSAQPANLLTNPGFETTGGWKSNWEWANVKSRMTIKKDPAGAFAGNGYLEVECMSFRNGATQGTTQFASHSFALKEGQPYRIRFHYRGERITKASFAVRLVPTPWTYYGRAEVSPVLEWNQGEFVFVSPVTRDDVALYISFEGEGKLFVDDVAVVPFDLPKVRPENTGNLLPNSSFELPLSMNDWALELFGPMALVKENTTDGRQSLAVRAKSEPLKWGQIRGNFLRSGKLSLRQFCDHTLAADLRADKPTNVTLSLLDGELKLMQKTFEVGTEWQRLSVTGNSLVAEKAYVTIVSTGPFQIDSVYLGEGETAPARFTPRSATEAYIKVQASPSKMFLTGQDVTAQIAAVFNDAQANKPLDYQVILEHWDGKTETALTGTVVPNADPISVKFKPARNGPYRVLLKVSGAPDALDGLAVISPRSGPPVKNSAFGGHVALGDPIVADIAAKMGIASGRLHWPPDMTQWRAVEKARGQWTFNDKVAERYAQYHMSMLGILQSTPNWAAEGKQLSLGTSVYSMANPNQIEDWRTYCRTVAAHWPQITDWELFNEPNVGIFWPGTNEQLMELAREAIRAVREANPHARFIVTNHPSLEVLSKAGILKDTAAISEHWYAHGSTVDARVDQISEWIRNERHELIRLNASHVELWNTEFGPGSWGGLMAGSETEYRRGVEYISKHLPSQRAQGVTRFYPYMLNLSTGASGFSGIEKDGTPSSGITAYAAVIQMLERATPAGELALKNKTFRAYQFHQEGDLIVYVWSCDQEKSLPLGTLPASVRVYDAFANQVQVDAAIGFIPIVMIGPEEEIRKLLPVINEQ